jgi:hypothetical protein
VTLIHLGDAHDVRGDAARESWLADLRHPDAEPVRERLFARV